MSDQQARDFAVANHATTLLVEAGAGTGKTTLLIDRICALIETGVHAEEIAAVTFTVKAAGEMKERLREALQKRGDSPRAQTALAELDRMVINTIHGLASELLRTLPVEAELPPGFTALDELQQEAARDEFLTHWLVRALNEDVPAALAVAEELGFKLQSKDEKRNLSILFDKLRTIQLDRERVTTHDDSAPSLESSLAQLANRVSALRIAAAACTDERDNFFMGLRAFFAWHDTRPASMMSVSGVRWLRNAPKAKNGQSGNWGGKAALDQVKQLASSAIDAILEARKALVSKAVQELLDWISPAVHEFRRTLAETGQIGFDDLLILCRDMLRKSRIARAHFKGRFKHLHIDEFQDTDPIQVEILFYLAETDSEFGDDWTFLNLTPGKLFVVGDPKQSIYGFRGADIRIYDRVVERISKTGTILNITRNFRSRADILTEVNAVFEKAMARAVDGNHVYSALEAARSDETAFPAVELLTPPADYDIVTNNAESAAQSEAAAIAEHLLSLHSRNELRNWSDAAILLRSSTHLAKLQDALTSRNVPFISFLTEGYTGRVEIEAALTLLSSLANPQNTVATIGALRSPWFAISDDELFRHKYSGGSFVYTDSQSPETPVGAALAKLARWHALASRLSAADLFESILCEYPIEIHYGLKSEGMQRVQNIATLCSLIRRLEAAGLTGLQTIVSRLFEIKKLEQSTELEARDKERQAVQLITLHKAKGLEFPVVYLYRMRDGEPKHVEWILHKSLDGGAHKLAVSFGNKEQRWRTQTADDCFAYLDDFTKAEEQRLQYVGMTRARDRLILPLGWAGKNENNLAAYLPALLLARYFDADSKRISAVGTCAVESVAAASQPSTFRPYQPRLDQLSDSTSSVAPNHWQEWQADRAIRLAQLTSESQLSTEPPAVVDWSRLHAQHVGTAVHAALERLAKRIPQNDALRFVERRFALTETEITDVARLVSVAAASPLFTVELPRARRVFTELPIIAHHAATDSANYVDLLFQDEAGRWIVVDFKTDDVTTEQARDTAEREHRKQLSGYAQLFESLTGAPPAELRVFFLRPAELVVL